MWEQWQSEEGKLVVTSGGKTEGASQRCRTENKGPQVAHKDMKLLESWWFCGFVFCCFFFFGMCVGVRACVKSWVQIHHWH